MKSINHGGWLGFSLSPNISMEVAADPHHHPNHQGHHPQAQSTPASVSPAVTSSFFLSPQSDICYGVEGGNGAFCSQLAVMPLKSDGSLCIMEALSRSQQEGSSIPPVCFVSSAEFLLAASKQVSLRFCSDFSSTLFPTSI